MRSAEMYSFFSANQSVEMYLADAMTALGILDVSPDEWHTDQGYPVFVFEPGRITEIQLRAFCLRLLTRGY